MLEFAIWTLFIIAAGMAIGRLSLDLTMGAYKLWEWWGSDNGGTNGQ